MAPPRKPCLKCKKQIPAIALDCVFCGAKQAPPPLEDLLPAAVNKARAAAAMVEAGGDVSDFADSFSTEPTLVGLRVADLAALGIGAPQPSQSMASPAPAKAPESKPAPPTSDTKPPPSTKVTQAMAAIPDTRPTPAPVAAKLAPKEKDKSKDVAPVARPVAAPHEATLVRVAKQASMFGGAILLLLFFMPWNGATSWQLLETLGGVAFIRQFHYLTGGLTLVLAGVLPLPPRFRTAVILIVGLAPLIAADFGVPWRGLTQLVFAAAGWAAMLRYGAGSARDAKLFGAVAAVVAALLLLTSRSGAEVMHLLATVVSVAVTGAAAATLARTWKSDAPSNVG